MLLVVKGLYYYYYQNILYTLYTLPLSVLIPIPYFTDKEHNALRAVIMIIITEGLITCPGHIARERGRTGFEPNSVLLPNCALNHCTIFPSISVKVIQQFG